MATTTGAAGTTTAAPAEVEAATTERHGRGDGRPDPGSAGAQVQLLFERHGRMVYGLCRLLLRDATEAEDAAQQVFVSAYGALLRGTVVREPAAWLAAAARNECRGRLRRRSEAPVAIEDATVELLEAPGDDGARVLAAVEVRRALAALPERQREAVVLRDVLGFRTGETAAALGLSRPAVESLVFRARRSLRVRLRHAASVAVLPLALREGVAEALPGFSGPARIATTATGGGLLAKLGAAPLAAKLAAGAAAVGTAGSVALELERPAPQPRPARSAPAPPARLTTDTADEHPVATVAERPEAVAVAVAVTTLRAPPRSRSVPLPSREPGDDRSGSGEGRRDGTTVETAERSGGSSGPGPGPSGPDPVPTTQTVVVETEPSSSRGPGSGDTTATVTDTGGRDGGQDGGGGGSGRDDGRELEDGSSGGPGPG